MVSTWNGGYEKETVAPEGCHLLATAFAPITDTQSNGRSRDKAAIQMNFQISAKQCCLN